MTRPPEERIAIVGLGGVFPGSAHVAEFWDNIAHGVDCGRNVPADRWALSPSKAFAPGGPQADRVYSTWGCFLDNVPDEFPGLTVDRHALAGLDPLVRIGLKAAADAVADARQPDVDPARAGIIFGHIVLPTESTSALARDVLLREFERRVLHAESPQSTGVSVSREVGTQGQTPWSSANWDAAALPARIIAQALGWQGTAYTLDAACASSLYALKLASDELLAHRADVMLAGGLSRPDCQYTQMGFSALQALSKRGRCAPLSAAADGLIVGEGAGLFVLKRLSDAVRDGDRIYATIAGIGLSNDRGANLLAPRSEGQLRAMQAAYQQAGWRPGDVDLIECHATGTPVGDAVELDSLHTLWREEAGALRRCVLGSVKSNVGHLLTAAGGASLMKLLFALQTKTLPPTANYVEPATGLNRVDSPFRVLSQAEPWEPRDPQTPRRAAINAFGFGGINAHVLLEEWKPAGSASQDEFSLSFTLRDDKVDQSLRDSKTSGHGVAGPLLEIDAIAIVGLAAHVGPWLTLRKVQERLFGGRTSDQPQHPTGWGLQGDREGFPIDKVRTPLGAFRIPPLELEEMLPQQQLMLQVTAAALDDAGLPRELGDRTGVFVGISLDPNTTNFHCRWAIAEHAPRWAEELGLSLSADELEQWIRELRDSFGPPLTANRVMGNLGGIVASRLAREFDIGGPSFTVSSSATSGGHALEIAIRALRQGELDRAIVGAVDLPSDIRIQLQAADDDGFADAAVALIVKRYADAVRDGDRIYAVIPTASREHQRPEPSPVLVVGGKGDESLRDSERSHRRMASLLWNTPLADCGAATGLLQIAQAALALHQQMLPPGQWQQGGESRFVPQQVWLRDRVAGPRRAVVNIAVDNATDVVVHLEEPLVSFRSGQGLPYARRMATLFVFDGDTTHELQAAIDECRAASADADSAEQAAQEWFRHRPPDQNHRLAATVFVASIAELRDALDQLAASVTHGDAVSDSRMSFDPHPLGRDGKLAFVFPGSGNHFLGMGRELLAAWPEMLRQQDAENERLASQYGADLIWNGPSTEALGRDHKRMIFGQVALGTAVCDWLSLLGVKPDAAIGYSLGESAALFGLRAWTDRDEMLRRMEQSSLFGGDLTFPFEAARKAWNIPPGEPVPWLSGVIDRSAEVVRQAMGRLAHSRPSLCERNSFRGAKGDYVNDPQVYLLIINTPSQCVIGGRREQVEQLVCDLDAQFVPFPAPSTVHCEVLQQVATAYTELHQMATQVPDGVTVYSGATGRTYEPGREACAAAILGQATDTVDFPRVIENAYADGVRLFVEIGPGSSCTRMIGEILGERPHWVRPVIPATADPVTHALRVLGELIVQRVPVDLTMLYGGDRSDHPANDAGPCVVTPTQGAAWNIARRSPGIAIPGRRAPALPGAPSPAPAPLPLAPPRRTSPPAPVVEIPPMPLRAAVTVASADSLPVAVADWDEWMTERIAAHEAFLNFAGQVQSLAEGIVLSSGAMSVDSIAREAPGTDAQGDVGDVRPTDGDPWDLPPASSTIDDQPSTIDTEPPRALDYEQCLEFAIGSIGKVLGPKFAEIDSFPTRVRLPDVPLQLVDRILEIEGEPLSMTQGRVVTEHDIHANDWYLDCGRIPTCLAVESGQADLFLSGWLGIDYQTRGLAMYRLLDAVVTFHDALPGPGSTIRYDIRINGFFRQGETYLFRFEFDATVNGQPLLTMRDGCAGFFTMAELAAGQGIVHTALDMQPRPGKRPDDWDDPVPMTVEAYDDGQLAALRDGDLAACFGPAFAELLLRNPETLPSGRLHLVHRVLQLDPTGGKYGIGQIRAEADIHPDDWFLTCHFCDDQVMPGTLMYECCLHTLRIYLLRMGWIGESGQVAYEPVPGVKSRLKCRGQVLASTQRVWYEVTLKEIGYGSPGMAIPGRRADSAPYCLADALMYADGKPIVEITDMSVRLSGLTREDIEQLWSADEHRTSAAQGWQSLGFIKTQPLFDTDRITEFAIGKPSKAFGDRYRIFDEDRVIARLPGPPFQFLDRITSIQNCEPWVLAAGGVIEAHYDVPPDAWYFAANRQRRMPFAVLLEAALQPCGWLAAYLGSALTSDVDLSFRNLGGKATQFRDVTPDSGTLTTTVKITRVSQSAGMIIQHYDFDLRQAGEPVYVGNTYFGFFSKSALENQVGIRDAGGYQPTAEELDRAQSFPVPTEPPFPNEQFRMVTNVDALILDGGPHGLGFIRGSVNVDPAAWFFQAHFYQDPVWPGSLGLESFLQLLKVLAAKRWGGGTEAAFAAVALNRPHEWIYRGQVIPRDKTVTVDVVVTAVDDATRTLTAGGFLTVDGRVIYQMIDFTVQMMND